MRRGGQRRSSLMALAVGAGGVLMLPGLAHSQAAPPPPAGRSAIAPAGGAGTKPLTIDVIGNILYDSNVSKGRDAVTAARDLHKSEVTYAPSVQVAAFLPIGRNALFLNGVAGYDFHEYNKELESGRVNVIGGGRGRVGPCEATLAGSYGVQQSNLADLPVRVTRNRQTTRGVNTQLTCMVGSGLTGFLGAGVSDTSNSADFNLVDSDSVTVNGGFGYGTRRLGTIQLIGGYATTDYGESTNPLVRLQPGFESYNVGVQYTRAIGNRLNGNASIGYQTVRSDDPLIGKSSNLTGSGALEYKVNSRMGLSLLYARAAGPSIIQGYDYILNESVNLGARYSLSSRIDTSFGVKWSKKNYKGTPLVLLDLPTKERTRSLFSQVSMQLGRTASVSLDVSQEKRTSSPDVFDYTAYQVGVTAKKSF